MRIAIPFDNGMIWGHFGHTQQFAMYDVENGTVVRRELVSTGGEGHGALAAFLFVQRADLVICGGIGPGAQNALASMGIEVIWGITGSADDAVARYLAGGMTSDPAGLCHHHDGEHTCSEHSCGEHSCH